MNWDVEILHDTTMWNEGFEHAREPHAVVTVASELDAADLGSWVMATYALSTRAWDDSDKAFTAAIHPSADQSKSALTLTEAKTVAAERIAEWLGL